MILKSVNDNKKPHVQKIKKVMYDENNISFKYFELCDERREKLFSREIAAEIGEKLSAFGIRRLSSRDGIFFLFYSFMGIFSGLKKGAGCHHHFTSLCVLTLR